MVEQLIVVTTISNFVCVAFSVMAWGSIWCWACGLMLLMMDVHLLLDRCAGGEDTVSHPLPFLSQRSREATLSTTLLTSKDKATSEIKKANEGVAGSSSADGVESSVGG